MLLTTTILLANLAVLAAAAPILVNKNGLIANADVKMSEMRHDIDAVDTNIKRDAATSDAATNPEKRNKPYGEYAGYGAGYYVSYGDFKGNVATQVGNKAAKDQEADAEAQSKSKRHIKSYGNYDDYTNSRGTYTSYKNYKGSVAAKVGEGE